MKIYISVDMEGAAGITHWHQEKDDRTYFRKSVTQQVEWLVEGIQQSSVNGQVDEILVADSHGQGITIPYEFTAMDERLHLVSGSPRPYYMMPALSDAYNVVFFAGYHSSAGTQTGVMDHTFTGCFHRVAVNDVVVSEALLNAAYAGYRGVPVGLIVGDEALRLELEGAKVLTWSKYVTTKTGLSRFAAVNRPLAVVKRETIAAVQKVLAQDLKRLPLYRFDSPVRMNIELLNTAMADIISMLPDINRLDARTIELVHEDFGTVYNARSALGSLAGLFR